MALNIKEIPLTCSLCSYIDFCISIDVPFLLQATLRILKMKKLKNGNTQCCRIAWARS
jgi:hypothetical protein